MICEKHKDKHVILCSSGQKRCFDCLDEETLKAERKLYKETIDGLVYGEKANDRQVGGTHYTAEIQHWDYAASHNMDYFQGQITKYVTRWKKKGGVQDLEKARHFLDKYIEINACPK